MAPLLVEYRCISRHPTCIGNERIRLERDGRLYWAQNSRECDEGQLWSAEWQYQGRVGGLELQAFMRLIQETGVLNLPEHSVDPDTEGGKREELELQINGKIHRCRLENTTYPAYSAVVHHLYGLMATVQLE